MTVVLDDSRKGIFDRMRGRGGVIMILDVLKIFYHCISMPDENERNMKVWLS